LLVQIHYRLTQGTTRSLTVVDLLRYPTVSALAQFLDQEPADKGDFTKAKNRAKRRNAARSRQRRARRR
ncbi:MAG: hypothetical protein AAFY88_26585, partial [Acidobacteriota bacterium]